MGEIEQFGRFSPWIWEAIVAGKNECGFRRMQRIKKSLFDEYGLLSYLQNIRQVVHIPLLVTMKVLCAMTRTRVYERSRILAEIYWRVSIYKKRSELESAASLAQGFCNSQAPTPIGFPLLRSSWSSMEADPDAAAV